MTSSPDRRELRPDADDGALRVAVVGTGYMTNRVYLPVLSEHADVRLVALCDRDTGRLQDASERYRVESCYENARAMLDAVELDAVFAIGDPHTMFDVWMDCIDRGTHLFIEKPMGLTLHQATVLAHAAAENGCITQVGFQRKATPLLRELHARCRAHGPVVHASVEFVKCAPGPFLGARDHMFDDGLHAIDTLRHVCGGEVTRIRSVARRLGTPDVNFVAALLEFDSGATGQIHCNWTSGMRRFKVAIHGPSVCAEGDLEGDGSVWSDGAEIGHTVRSRDLRGAQDDLGRLGFRAKIADFLRCLGSSDRPESDFEDALKTHVIAERILALELLGLPEAPPSDRLSSPPSAPGPLR